MKQNFKYIGLIVLMLLVVFAASAKDYDIREFGAVSDAKTVNTKAIQAAIDACTNNGGGTVLLSGGGKFMTGTIFLKSNVTLRIDNGTTLLGSNKIDDYATNTHKNMYRGEPHMDRCLIFAQEAKSVAIEGYGVIDGNGHPEFFSNKSGRPMLIRFLNCSDIHVNDITLLNPAAWTSAWLYCNNISVNGITIVSRSNANGDGLDFDGCTNVRVTNSNFDNSDDCICLQTSRPDKPCRNVVVSNCIFTTKWGGMRIGLLSRGNIESVTVTNCTFRDIQDSGLKIQQNEGGEMKNLTFSNLVMENVPRPIFMTFCQQRACTDTPEGELEPLKRMHHMMFSNIVIDNSKGDKNSAILFTGFPGHYIEDICMKDIQFVVSGGGTIEDAANVNLTELTPEALEGKWPEFKRIGTLPAFGVYARHINGLVMDNVSIKTIGSDARKPYILNDVLSPVVGNMILNGKLLEKYQVK